MQSVPLIGAAVAKKKPQDPLAINQYNQWIFQLYIPLFNEEESLPELCEWIVNVMNENNYSYEIIMVDDGSTDCSWKVIEELSNKNKNIKGIKFQRNYGKSPR